MKIFIVGSTGRVAEELIKELVEKGHQVSAAARRPDDVIKADRVHPVDFDLSLPVAEMAEKLQGHDAVYFAAGSRGKALLSVDAYGAVKTMQAAEKAGVKRYIMVSSIGADKPSLWDEEPYKNLQDYLIAKFFADQWLIGRTELDYTILQPTALEEREATGKVTFDEKRGNANAIPNVAKVLAELLEAKQAIGKTIEMSDGDTPITIAIESL